MTAGVYSEGPSALLCDPLWQQSGAETVQEYARWAVNICGMACLKMILASRGETYRMFDLARSCTRYGGYLEDSANGSIKGLIYAPFIEFVREQFNLQAQTVIGLEVGNIARSLVNWDFFIASVHSDIRYPDRTPASKGGHLILVTAADARAIHFHNPAGDNDTNQANVCLAVSTFDRFFAQRGIMVGSKI